MLFHAAYASHRQFLFCCSCSILFNVLECCSCAFGGILQMCSALSTPRVIFHIFQFCWQQTVYVPMPVEHFVFQHLYKYCIHTVVFQGCNANLHLSSYTWTDWTALVWLEHVMIARHNSSPWQGWQWGLCRCNTLLNCQTWTGFAVEVKSAFQQITPDSDFCSIGQSRFRPGGRFSSGVGAW